MTPSKLFSGPPSNKATASTLAAAVTTLFWTIAAHTFWKTMNTADLALYIATSTVLLTAIIGFLVPESAAYAAHTQQRLTTRAAAEGSTSAIPAIVSAIQDLEAKVQWSQQLDRTMARRLGIALPAATSSDGPSLMPGPQSTRPSS